MLFIIRPGNNKIEMAIPLIIPYADKAVLHARPLFSSCIGINNCLKVFKPERIHEVIATGIEIFSILDRKFLLLVLVSFNFLLSNIYKK